MRTICVKLSSAERCAPWLAEVGWAHYVQGYRLATRPLTATHRPWLVRVKTNRLAADLPCPARYALLLGRACVEGKGFIRPRAYASPQKVVFHCPTLLAGEGLREAVTTGLEAISNGAEIPVVPSTGKRVSIYLSRASAEKLSSLGGNRSSWLRAAAAIGRCAQRQQAETAD